MVLSLRIHLTDHSSVVCRVNVGDIVICSKREFEPAKGDIIQKYTSDQARELKAERKLPIPHRLSGRQQALTAKR